MTRGSYDQGQAFARTASQVTDNISFVHNGARHAQCMYCLPGFANIVLSDDQLDRRPVRDHQPRRCLHEQGRVKTIN